MRCCGNTKSPKYRKHAIRPWGGYRKCMRAYMCREIPSPSRNGTNVFHHISGKRRDHCYNSLGPKELECVLNLLEFSDDLIL